MNRVFCLYFLIFFSALSCVFFTYKLGYLDPYIGAELGQKQDWLSIQLTLLEEEQNTEEKDHLKIVHRMDRCLLVNRRDKKIDIFLLTPTSGTENFLSMSSEEVEGPRRSIEFKDFKYVIVDQLRQCKIPTSIWIELFKNIQ